MTTADQPIVDIVDLKKHYQMGDTTVRALNGINFTILHGEFWSIMGPSGSGKSTILNLLGCLDRPTDGHYRLGGIDVSEMDDDELSEIRNERIGFIFQSFNLIAQLTVLENIEVPLFYQGWDPQDSRERAFELAEKVGLGSRTGHRPRELSGGQQQRVAIARAMANDPLILLADEPTGNLDSKTEAEILEMLQELNDQGKTLIVVTHEPKIANIAQWNLKMRDGLVDTVRGPEDSDRSRWQG
ncbi:MAG: ABC transporter ATP-binding protein [Planctomycetota bacterium]